MFKIENVKTESKTTTADVMCSVSGNLEGSFKMEEIGFLADAFGGGDRYFKLVVDFQIGRGGVELMMHEFLCYDGRDSHCYAVNVMQDAFDGDVFVVIQKISSNY